MYATALMTEASNESQYKVSLMQLEEAKGTLLDHDQIAVAEPGSKEALSAPAKAQLQPGPSPPPDISDHLLAAFEPTAAAPVGPAEPAPPAEIPPTATPDATPSNPTSAKPSPASNAKTYKFHVSIGAGPRPFEVRGSFTVAPGGEE